jgi:N-acyl homoserine lactone hydrolase
MDAHWVWVIEHPEGIFLVDTGSNSKVNNPEYFKLSGWFSNWINRRWFKFRVEKNDEIESQLKTIGLVPNSINTVILTHLHLDHTDGLQFFENSRVVINKTEWEKPYGHLPKLFPKWLKPNLVEMTEDIMGFKGKYLTKAKDIILIHTPGHTFGHTSVLFKADTSWVLFAGDVCYSKKQIWEGVFSGANVTYKKANDTYQKIKQFCTTNNVIILPSHDKDAVYRLKNEVFSI